MLDLDSISFLHTGQIIIRAIYSVYQGLGGL